MIYFVIDSLASVGIEEIGRTKCSAKMFQLDIQQEKGWCHALGERCNEPKFDCIALTVDTFVSGNRERCLRTGFSSPPPLTPSSAISFATHPRWTLDYLFREKFELTNLKDHVSEGTNVALSVADYFNKMLDPSMDWKTAENVRAQWGGEFGLK